MNTNRLTPHQMAIGNTADATRIEQCLMRLAELYDDVPPEFVQRRWSPSPLVWGFTPPQQGLFSASFGLPFLPNTHGATFGGKPTCNPQRVKSCAAPGLIAAEHRTWEVSCLFSRPKIIGSLAVFAEVCGPVFPSRPKNEWLYGATPPAPFDANDPTQDFTLQVCISDGWDLENRKKLRQESLTYQTRSDAFKYSQRAISGAPTALPKSPHNSKWAGFAVTTQALVLVPAGARVIFQWTIPQYAVATDSTWPVDPRTGNVWSLNALCYSPTVRR